MKIDQLNLSAVRSNNQVQKANSLSDEKLRQVVGGQRMIEFFCRGEFGELECIIYI